VYAEVFKYIYLILEGEKEYQVQDSRRQAKKNLWAFNIEEHLLSVAGKPI
jgi:hypothetical protein